MISLLLLAVHLLAILHILWTKHRDSSSAAMWLLAVTLLPGIGLLFYLFFGITSIDRVHSRRQALQSELSQPDNGILGGGLRRQRDAWGQFVPPLEVLRNPRTKLLDRLFPQRLALDGNSLEILCDGTMVYPRMLADIEAAKICIRLESFILMDDQIGRQLLDTLERKAAEGVDVKVLFDSFGSAKAILSHYLRHYFRKSPNFKIQAFSPLNLLTPWKFQLRNHRKLLIIDGIIAYSGGLNISQDNGRLAKVPPNRYIHDLHCRITGPAVSQFIQVFLQDWAYTTRRHLEEFALPADFPELKRTGDAVVRVIESGPGENRNGSQNLFFAAAAIAQRSLYIMTPYLVPGNDYINALCMAASRGVDVRIIVPAHNNHWFVDWAARSNYQQLLEYGIRIFEKQGIFSHAKALLVDSAWGFMGSSNCDSRSFRLNYELDFCFSEDRSVDELHRQFNDELADSAELSLHEVERRSPFMQILENCCSLLTPIL